MITQREIAEKLGISRTTVARALNDNGSIHPETRKKIMELAEKHGYKKNIMGSSLATRNNKIIYAFIVKSINNYYSKMVKDTLKNLKKEYELYGVELKIIETPIEAPEAQLEKLKEIITNKVDGILIVPLLKDEIAEIIKNNSNIKFVTFDASINNEIYYVGPDYFKSGRIAADVLVNLLGDTDKVLLLDTKADNISSKDYHNGFFDRLNESNLKILGPIYSENLRDNYMDILDKYYTNDIKSIYSSRYIDEIVDYILENREKFGKLKIVVDGLSKKTKKQLEDNNINAIIVEQTEKVVKEAFKLLFNWVAKNEKLEEKHIVLRPKILFKEVLS